MSTEYRLDVYTQAGAKVAEITDFLHLEYTRQVNAPGLLGFTLLSTHAALSEIETGGWIVVYRRNRDIGLEWVEDFCAVVRYRRCWYTEHDLTEIRGAGLLSLLAGRIVAWRAGTSARSYFHSVAAETIMKTLVNYNAGPGATMANGRLREGAISGLSVQADGGHGNVLSMGCAYDNVLEVLQRISLVGGGDFDLVRTGSTTCEFRWYTGQRGIDRTATVLFALERGNMAEPEFVQDGLDERTVVLVGGQGEGSARMVVVRTGPDYSSTNDIETFVDARNCETTAELNAAGDARLQEKRRGQQLTYHVFQTPGCAYGVHYGFGDLVTARYGVVQMTQKISSVGISLAATGAETVRVQMETV